VRLAPDGLTGGFGASQGIPLTEVTLEVGRVDETEGVELWHLRGELPLPDGPVAYDQRLALTTDGRYLLRTAEAALVVDRSAGRMKIDAPEESLTLQLVTTYGLPILLSFEPVLVLHACAAIPPGGERAVLVCGASGTGKSSLLAGMLEAGWRAASEDVCTVDLRGPHPVVWPGPPWLRLAGTGPPGSTARFTTPDKTAWDIAPWRVDEPAPVGRIVFLEPAGGADVLVHDLDRGESIHGLARSTVWLVEPERRASQTFGRCVTVAGAVSCATLRMPVAADWVGRAVAVLRLETDDA
jgi:hypothetical protein